MEFPFSLVVKCPAIKPPSYGAVVPSSCMLQSGVGYNTDCFFTCNVKNHYRLEGPSKVSCLENGSWSGDISNVTCKGIKGLTGLEIIFRAGAGQAVRSNLFLLGEDLVLSGQICITS